MENRAEGLTRAHWDYVNKVLESAGCDEEFIAIIWFHYTSAMFHGYNHGWEDAITSIKESIPNDLLDMYLDTVSKIEP